MAPAPLCRIYLANLKLKRRAALAADYRSVFGHIDGRRAAGGALGGGVGGIRQRIGRRDARHHAAFSLGLGLERGPAGAANVVVAAVGRAGIKHLARTAYRTRKFELARLHAHGRTIAAAHAATIAALPHGQAKAYRLTALPSRRTRGRKPSWCSFRSPPWPSSPLPDPTSSRSPA